MGKMKWPADENNCPVNVDAIIRGLEATGIVLGLEAPGDRHFSHKSFSVKRDMTTMVNHPGIAMKDDISKP